MEELIERLKKSCEEMELFSELTEKYKDNRIVANNLFNKKVEDGIIAKLHTASITQLKIMKNNYKFNYYSKDITDKLIDSAILKITRKEKLKVINSIEQ